MKPAKIPKTVHAIREEVSSSRLGSLKLSITEQPVATIGAYQDLASSDLTADSTSDLPWPFGQAILAPGSGEFTVFGADGTPWLSRNCAGTVTESRVTASAMLDPRAPATFISEPSQRETRTLLSSDVILEAGSLRYQAAVSDLAGVDEGDDDGTWMDLVNWTSADAVTTSHHESNAPGSPTRNCRDPSAALLPCEDIALWKLTDRESCTNLAISRGEVDHDYLFNDLEDTDLLDALGGVSTVCNSCASPNVNGPLESEEEDNVDLDRSSAYSPPYTVHSSVLNSFAEQVLDEDVDWEAVIATTDQLEQQPQPPISRTQAAANSARAQEYRRNPGLSSDRIAVRNISSPMTASPFVRPPFPSPIPDRSSVPGLSQATVTRTCFRTGELVNAAAQSWKENLSIRSTIVFELFARVTNSYRDPAARTQYFQFKDLFTDHQPYPSGTWRDWKPGSFVDQQASALLGEAGKGRTCRCVARIKRELGNDLGWGLEMLAVRETSWDEIQWVRGILARDGPEL